MAVVKESEGGWPLERGPAAWAVRPTFWIRPVCCVGRGVPRVQGGPSHQLVAVRGAPVWSVMRPPTCTCLRQHARARGGGGERGGEGVRGGGGRGPAPLPWIYYEHLTSWQTLDGGFAGSPPSHWQFCGPLCPSFSLPTP